MPLLNLVWIFKTLKYVLFWLYLWQLKEYHAGRFLDHFRTTKGKEALVNYLAIAQAILLALFLFAPAFNSLLSLILLLVYLAQGCVFAIQLRRKSVKRPASTAKAMALAAIAFAGVLLYAIWTFEKSPAWLLIADIFLPILVSGLVLLVQPFSVAVRGAYLRRAALARKKLTGLKVIAITGSYGKTSTKEFLATILSEKFNVLATKEHQNSEISIARTIMGNITREHQIFIAEVGAYNKGKVREVCSMLLPDMGVVTGVNEQHLSLFGSMENLLSAEGGRELENALPGNGMVFVNGDNRHCLDLYKKSHKPRRLYAASRGVVDADIFAESVDAYIDRLVLVTRDKAGNLANFSAPVLGKHLAQNLLGAILVARELGMSYEEIMAGVGRIRPEQAGMTAQKNRQGIWVIDASYSSNPTGVAADLEYLSLFSGKKIIVMPCLIELGKKSKEVHHALGKKISGTCDMAIITSTDRLPELRAGAREGGMGDHQMVFCDNPHDIHALVTLFCSTGDSVLVEGGKQKELVRLLNQ